MNGFVKLLAAGAIVIGTGSVATADTVAIEADRDNTLYESLTGALSNGGGDSMFAGRTGNSGPGIVRCVVRFDVAGNVPAGSTINSVSLDLHLNTAAGGASHTVSVYPVDADWGEGSAVAAMGGGGGAASANGDVTWTDTFRGTSTWTSAGGDFDNSTLLSSTTVGQVAGTVTFATSANFEAEAQDWLDNASNNFGVLLQGDESEARTAKSFATREATTAAQRPTLNIDFTPPANVSDWHLY